MSYAVKYLADAALIAQRLDSEVIDKMVSLLVDLRTQGGRLFILGVGGGAGHASHAVCDFRKIAGIEAYTPCDNVSELTARANDEGWDTTYAAWLAGCKLCKDDMILVFSVGGGDLERGVSPNLVRALEYAGQVKARIMGVVGRDGGYTARVADACVVVPTVDAQTVTAHTESFQALVWHLLVTHPDVQIVGMKWETIDSGERKELR